MRRFLTGLLIAAALALAPAAGRAVEPGEMLDDPALEARARAISQELRCLVCQNQSIDDSNADLARDLRLLVRRRLSAGDTDDAVVAFITARYGDFVLLKPPFKATTYVLWFGPVVIFLAGAAGLIVFFRRRAAGGAAGTDGPPLSADERRRLDDILQRGRDA